jgi:hypothetical protein
MPQTEKGRGSSPEANSPEAIVHVKPPQEGRVERERATFHLPVELMERVRNCVFWTPGLTMGGLAEVGIRHALAAREKKNGGPFQPRKSNLKGGRPMK